MQDLVHLHLALLGAVHLALVDLPQLVQAPVLLVGRHEVDLVEYDPIGVRDLVDDLARLELLGRLEVSSEVLGVDHADDAVEVDGGVGLRVDPEYLGERARVGQAAALQEDVRERLALQQLLDAQHEVGLDRAADAPVAQLEQGREGTRAVARVLQLEADLHAERRSLVLDDRDRLVARGEVGEDACSQGGRDGRKEKEERETAKQEHQTKASATKTHEHR